MKRSKAITVLLKGVFPEEMKRAAQGRCPFCGELVDSQDFRDELSRREFSIFGICQKCQDNYFGGGKDGQVGG